MSAPGPGRRPAGKSEHAFRTISEVSEELGVPQHVLRFWESRFTQVKPMKRNGGRRLYRPDHISLLRGIRALLYDDGMTIKGVQKVLREKGVKAVAAHGAGELSLLPAESPPEDAPERLAALRERLDASAAAPEAGSAPVPEPERPAGGSGTLALAPEEAERVRGSIRRLEAILARLEA